MKSNHKSKRILLISYEITIENLFEFNQELITKVCSYFILLFLTGKCEFDINTYDNADTLSKRYDGSLIKVDVKNLKVLNANSNDK